MPREGAISGEAVVEMVKTAARVHGDPAILDALQDAATSCQKWGSALQSLFVEDSLVLYNRTPNSALQPSDWIKIELRLRQGQSVLASVKLPGSRDHIFTIIAEEGRARVLHAWEGHHAIRAERSMPIQEMMSLLEKLPTYDYTKVDDIAKVREVRKRLWGSDHMGPTEPIDCPKPRISFEAVITGESKQPLIECKEKLGRLSFELCEWSSARSSVSSGRSSFASAVSEPGRPSFLSGRASGQSTTQTGGAGAEPAVRVRYAAGFGAALGFLLGAGGALWNEGSWEEVLEEGAKTGLAMGVGEGAGALVAKSVKPTFATAGVSVVRANAAAGVAVFSVFALWDVAKWAKHDITAVELRQNLAEGAAGTAGGVAGGVAGGLAAGALFGPVGAFLGGLVGGIAGGFGGAAAGKAIDKAMWDESEDSVMNAYEFFGWHNVDRGTRPIQSADSIKTAYIQKLDENPSKKITDKNWATCCTANLMVLLRAMFPELIKMLNIAEDLHNNSSKATSIVGSLMYNSYLDCPSISTPGTKKIFNGTYLIENAVTQRYVFQDGNPIQGNRGDEKGWLAHSGFQSPKVVGADANYYNRAYWKITHCGDGKHTFENMETKRLLLQDGEPLHGDRGEEGGWLSHSGFQSPQVLGADANYYNRALWYILLQSNGNYFIENFETSRYLFQDGEPIKGKRGAEGGWLAHSGFESPNVVGADANYYNRAYFRFVKVQ